MTTYTINSTSPTYTLAYPSVTSSSVLTYDGTNPNWGGITTSPDLNGSTLHVKGNANFEGDVKIQGKSIVDSLERIEERLAILRPNTELEEKWDQLRGLRKMYMELEAEIKEKEQIWATLKK